MTVAAVKPGKGANVTGGTSKADPRATKADLRALVQVLFVMFAVVTAPS